MAFPIGTIVGGPVLGVLSDRVFMNRKWVVFTSLLFNAVLFVPFAGFVLPPSWSLAVLVFFGIGFCGACTPLMYAHIKELVPPSLSGTGMTTVNFFTMAGAALFQHGMGVVIGGISGAGGRLTTEALSYAFSLCGLAVGVGCIGYLFVRDVRL
jgi:MFS family permease